MPTDTPLLTYYPQEQLVLFLFCYCCFVCFLLFRVTCDDGSDCWDSVQRVPTEKKRQPSKSGQRVPTGANGLLPSESWLAPVWFLFACTRLVPFGLHPFGFCSVKTKTNNKKHQKHQKTFFLLVFRFLFCSVVRFLFVFCFLLIFLFFTLLFVFYTALLQGAGTAWLPFTIQLGAGF